MNTILSLKQDASYEYFAGNGAQEALFQDVIAGNEFVIDCAKTRITSDCTPLLSNATVNGINFIDSILPWRDAILRENSKRKPVSDTLPLPAFDTKEDPVTWVRNLNKDVVYTLPPNINILMTSLVILATLSRPKLQFALTTADGVIFDTISELITVSVLCHYDEFYYHSPEGIEILKLENGKVFTQRLGYCTIAEACETGSLVPTVFGREKLINDPNWDPLVSVCLSTINSMRQAKAITLRDVLEVKS